MRGGAFIVGGREEWELGELGELGELRELRELREPGIIEATKK